MVNNAGLIEKLQRSNFNNLEVIMGTDLFKTLGECLRPDNANTSIKYKNFQIDVCHFEEDENEAIELAVKIREFLKTI